MFSRYKHYLPLLIFIFLIVVSFLMVQPLLLAVFLGALLAYIFFPVYNYVKRWLKNETVSSIFVCVLLFLVLVIPAVFLVKSLVQESYILYLLAKQKLAVGLFRSCENAFCNALQEIGNNQVFSFQVKKVIEIITNWVIGKGSNFLLSVPWMILNAFIIFFTLFYFLKDGKKLTEKFNNYFKAQGKNYIKVEKRLKEILHGVVYGYLLVAMIQGAFAALGFFLFGVPSPLFWGVVTAFLALIPFLGTGVIWVPASLILLLDGIFQNSNSLILKGIGLFIYSFIFVASVDNFLKPKLIGDKAKVHSAIIMIGIFGGILLFGPLGVVIGPLILSITVEMVDRFLLTKKSSA